MDENEYALLKSKFRNAFASVPLKLRHEIIAIIDNNPVSWTAAYAEIERDTSEARKILEQLKILGLLKDEEC